MVGKVKMVSPLPEHHVETVWEWCEYFRDEMMADNCPKNLEEMQAQNTKEVSEGGLQYFFTDDDGLPLGFVWGTAIGDGMFFGHLVFERAKFLNTSEKLAMAKQAISAMFRDGARKIIWQLFTDNRAFRIFLKKCGAEYEGCLRQMVRRNGELVDTDMMASFPKVGA